ncbi:hypothetical protein RAS12_11810 [Achromobacter seleniivolatilans]|uniref:Uncharacterized protein n=1 Tax=Achromobacter seleniivolatilans TaxID=3047478 RepID=A0ABY9M8M3_9BURK|nr:hypothetical protein [Achromobacter sp. R39]WMD23022.1 hypothetical protein RAS12_11810 [Achromobacter sp. R39]
MTQFVYVAEHEFFYSTKTPVPIAEVIEGLQGLERLLRSLPRAIEKASGVSILDSEIYVEEIKSGSLIEKVAVKLFFNTEQEFEDFLSKVKTKLDGSPMIKGTLITALIAGLVGYGIYLAAKTAPAPTPNITANNNVIINIGAGEVGMTPDAFRAIVETAVIDKKDFARAAVKLMKPARGDTDASIVLDGRQDIAIEPAAIVETPLIVNIEPQKRVDELQNAVLLLRAGDMDRKNAGWAGAVEGKTERLPIQLDPTVDPAHLFGRSKVIADIALVFHQDNRSGNMVAKSIFVRHVH